MLSWGQIERLVGATEDPRFLPGVEPRGTVKAVIEAAVDGSVRCLKLGEVHPLVFGIEAELLATLRRVFGEMQAHPVFIRSYLLAFCWLSMSLYLCAPVIVGPRIA